MKEKEKEKNRKWKKNGIVALQMLESYNDENDSLPSGKERWI